jgi:hypothetical protein
MGRNLTSLGVRLAPRSGMTAVASNRIRAPIRRRHWGLALVALVVVLVVIVIGGTRKLERDALSRMDPADRRALYDSTFRNAEALCARAPAQPVFTERCVAQTEFLLRFPECDAACVELARRHRPQPTR